MGSLLVAALAAALAVKPGGIPRVPVASKRGRQMVHAKGAVQRDTPPALLAEQRAWNQQIEAKRKARGKQ